jgi:hypothetical protein
MPDPGQIGVGPADPSRTNSTDIETNVDAASLVLAAAFGPVSFPPDMSDFLKAAILEKAEQLRSADGQSGLDSRLKSAQRNDRDEDGENNMAAWATLIEQEQEEREEWARTRSSVGGVAMTGAEWKDFAKKLREDDKLREEILEAFVRRGMTRDEAERRYQRVIDIAEIAAIPPSQRTEEQQHEFEKAQADPTFKADVSEAAAFAKTDNGQRLATQPVVNERNVALSDGPLI